MFIVREIILLCTTIYNKLSIIKDLPPFLDITLTWNSMIWAVSNPGKKIPSSFYLKRNPLGKPKLFTNFPKKISRVSTIPWCEASALELRDRPSPSRRSRVWQLPPKKVRSVTTISTVISLGNWPIRPFLCISSCRSKPSSWWGTERKRWA